MSEAPLSLAPPREPAVELPSSASAAFAYGWRLGWIEERTQLLKAADTITRQQAEIERLREALKRCADELEDEVNASYSPHSLEYPHNVQKKKNDMEAVVEARDALNGQGE